MRSLCSCQCFVFCFFKQKTAYEMRISDWSSDVCSSDLMAAAEPDIGEGRMRAVEHSQFRRLIRRNVGDELSANRLPARARAGEIILDHPLAEAFGDHGALIARAEGGFDGGAVGIGCRGDDAVDHRRGTGAFAIEPRSEEHTSELQSLMRNSYAVF